MMGAMHEDCRRLSWCQALLVDKYLNRPSAIGCRLAQRARRGFTGRRRQQYSPLGVLFVLVRATTANLGFTLAKAMQRWNELLLARFAANGFPDVRASYGSVLLPLY